MAVDLTHNYRCPSEIVHNEIEVTREDEARLKALLEFYQQPFQMPPPYWRMVEQKVFVFLQQLVGGCKISENVLADTENIFYPVVRF